MKTNRATKGFAGLALAGAVVISGPTTAGAEVVHAAPIEREIVRTELHRADAPLLVQRPNPQQVKSSVTWLYKTVVEGVIQWIVAQGIEKLNFVGPQSAEAVAAAFWASVPSVSAGSVGSPERLVLLAKQAPGPDAKSRTAYVKSNAEELFRAITSTSGCLSSSKTSAKCGIQTIKLSPGSKSSKPTITVSTSVRSTKVVVLH